MSKTATPLMSPPDFSTLTLAEKNQYLQQVAQLVAEARNASAIPLDKDALSRLRRFYTRRRASDLQLESVKDPDMRAALQSMANTMHLGEVRKLIAHETKAEVVTTYREPPADDGQLS